MYFIVFKTRLGLLDEKLIRLKEKNSDDDTNRRWLKIVEQKIWQIPKWYLTVVLVINDKK